MAVSHIQVSVEVRDVLYLLKGRERTYDDILRELLKLPPQPTRKEDPIEVKE